MPAAAAWHGPTPRRRCTSPRSRLAYFGPQRAWPGAFSGPFLGRPMAFENPIPFLERTQSKERLPRFHGFGPFSLSLLCSLRTCKDPSPRDNLYTNQPVTEKVRQAFLLRIGPAHWLASRYLSPHLFGKRLKSVLPKGLDSAVARAIRQYS